MDCEASKCDELRMIYSAHLTRVDGAPFEFLATVSVIPSFSRHLGDEFDQFNRLLIDAYSLIARPDAATGIGGRSADWISEITSQNFDHVVESTHCGGTVISSSDPVLLPRLTG